MTRALIAAAVLSVGLAACATTPPGGVGLVPPPASFSVADFAWSAQPGRAAIDGRVDFRLRDRSYACVGSVGLTPDTPYTRARFHTLYGSVNRAAIPAGVVRQRTVADPNADYRGFVRSQPCQNGGFRFEGLPDGGWFLIVPVVADGEDPIVLMRRVETRGGRTLSITM